MNLEGRSLSNVQQFFKDHKTHRIIGRFAAKVRFADQAENQENLTPRVKKIKVFISYSWNCRKEAVHEMVKFLLKQTDFQIFIDLKNVATRIHESMTKGIDDADVVLAFFSREYTESPNCRREIEYAASKKKEIIPIRVDRQCEPDSWLLGFFQSRHRFEFCEGDNFSETATQICEQIRNSVSPQKRSVISIQHLLPEVDPSINFRCSGIPYFSFSKAKYFCRAEIEEKLLSHIQILANCSGEGCLVITGDAGVGKTTLMTCLLTDDKNRAFFTRECNFHRVIWLNCFDWREGGSFDEKAFDNKLVSLAKELDEDDTENPPDFANIQGLRSYYKKKNLRVAFVFDDMFNLNLIQTFMAKHGESPICIVITRDPQTLIEASFGIIQKVERIDELQEHDVKEMLKTIFKLDRLLDEAEIQKLAPICCGLPLIANLIAARVLICEDRIDAKSEYRLLTSAQLRISDVVMQSKAFKTISKLLTLSLDHMDHSLRNLFFAFLLFNPAESVSMFDLGILWGFELDEASRYGLRGVCRAFEKRSLIRRIRKRVTIPSAAGPSAVTLVREPTNLDENEADKFLVHQLLFEAAIGKVKKDFYLNSGHDDESLEQIRFHLAKGDMATANREIDEHDREAGLVVLLNALKYSRFALLERIIDNLNVEKLAFLMTRRSSQTNGMAFLHYLYHFTSNSTVCYKIIEKVLMKFGDDQDLLLRVVIEKQTGKQACLLMAVLNDSKNEHDAIDRFPLVKILMPFSLIYSELLWEADLFEADPPTHPMILSAFSGDFDQTANFYDILAGSTDEKTISGAVQTAARRGFLNIVEWLVEKCPHLVATFDSHHRSPILLAAMNGRLNVVEFLYEKYPEIAAIPDHEQQTAVIYCSKNGHLDCVKFFHEKNPDLFMATDAIGDTALMKAASNGRLEVVQFLCEKCPELIEMQSLSEEGTALTFAATRGHVAVLEYLCDKFQHEDRVKALTMAAIAGKIDIVKCLMERDPEASKTNDPNLKMSALMFVASTGHLPIVQLLYGKADAVSEGNVTALMMAVVGGHFGVVKFLLSKDPNMVYEINSDGETADTLAKSLGHREILQYLHENS